MKYLCEETLTRIKDYVKSKVENEIRDYHFWDREILKTEEDVKTAIEEAMEEIMEKHFIKVCFDSPFGCDSINIKYEGDGKIIGSSWTGIAGYRGETTVVLRKSDFRDEESVFEFLRSLEDSDGYRFVDAQTRFKIILGNFEK